MCEFKQRMKDNFISESPKFMSFNRYIFDNNVLQFYLDHPVNYIYKLYICKLCISAQNLNIETGRFYDLDGHERVCSMCSLNVVEDEYHHIRQCEKYYWLRLSFFKLVQLLSVYNSKELNNLGKYLSLAEKICNASFISFRIIVLHIYYHAPLLVS